MSNNLQDVILRKRKKEASCKIISALNLRLIYVYCYKVGEKHFRDVLVLLLFLVHIPFVALFLAGSCSADELRSGACVLLLAGGTSQVENQDDQDGPMEQATEPWEPDLSTASMLLIGASLCSTNLILN